MVARNDSRDKAKLDEPKPRTESYREMSTGYAAELHLNEELASRNQTRAAGEGSDEYKPKHPEAEEADASSSEIEGGKEAADEFVDEAKKR